MTAPGRWPAGLAVMVAAVSTVFVTAQPVPETFTGTASIRKGEARVSAPLTVTITDYASDAERDAVLTALREHGNAGARRTLAAMKDAGVIQVGDRRTPIKFAAQRATGSGRLVTLLTAEPVLFIGGGLPDAKPRDGFDLALAILDLGENGGTGELVPAAKIGVDRGGALITEDYGAMVVWLHDLVRTQ
jgi:hypothetical protein